MASPAFKIAIFILLLQIVFRFHQNPRWSTYTFWSQQWESAREYVEHSTLRSLPTRLGMVRYQDVCIDRGKGGKSDFNGEIGIRIMNNHSRRLAAGQWVRVTGGKSSGVAQHWVKQPSLLLTGPRSNPNHQLWDVLFSLFPVGYVDVLPFVQWVAPYSTCNYWMCDKVDHLFYALGHSGVVHNSVVVTENQSVCFREVWVPHFAAYRHEMKAPSNFADALPAFRRRLVKGFSSPTNAILIYGRADARYRYWKNAELIAKCLRNASNVRVNYVSQMGALAPSEQCRAFWDARIIMFPHGGHSANLICARPGTKILEMACAKTVGWFQQAKRFHRSLGLEYTYRRVPYSNCSVTEEPDKDWSFMAPEIWARNFIKQYLLQAA